MTSARSCGLGSLIAIVVPGRTLAGSVRKASSVFSSHVMPDAVIALEYLAPATVPAGRPKTPDRCGPTLFCSVTAWHALQPVNSVLPLPALPSAEACAVADKVSSIAAAPHFNMSIMGAFLRRQLGDLSRLVSIGRIRK